MARSIVQLRLLPRRVLTRFAPERAAEDLFEADFYTSAYPDVRASGLAPIAHYRLIGASKSRAPNTFVDVASYRFDHPDVAKFGGDVLLHYVRVGRPRGATLHPLFDATWYRRNNPDVGSRDPYEHFLHHGRAEGRAPSAADSEVGGNLRLPPSCRARLRSGHA